MRGTGERKSMDGNNWNGNNGMNSGWNGNNDPNGGNNGWNGNNGMNGGWNGNGNPDGNTNWDGNNWNSNTSQEIPLPGGMGGYPQQVYPYDPNGKKGGGKKVLIAVLCVVFVVLLAGGVALGVFFSSPTWKITKGLQNLAKEMDELENPLAEKIGFEQITKMQLEEGAHTKTKLNLSSEMINDLLDMDMTIGFDSESYKDMKAKELSGSASLSVTNYELANIDIYANDDILCFSIPQLFLENMYFDTENIVSQYNQSILAEDGNFGKLDMEEFSLNLFEVDPVYSESVEELPETVVQDLNALRKAMEMDKVEKGLYRIKFPQAEADKMMQDYFEESDFLSDLLETAELEFDEIVCSDVSILMQINGQNRIEGIWLEEPVALYDGQTEVGGEIFFAGEARSIDKVQGKMSVEDTSIGEVMELIMQYVPTRSGDSYQTEVNVKIDFDDETAARADYKAVYDASNDEFEIDLTARVDEDSVAVSASGGFDNIVYGERYDMNLDELTMSMYEEEVYKLTGEIMIEPLTSEIKTTLEPETRIFEMSEDEWLDVIEQIAYEYEGLFDMLFGYGY